MIRYYADLDEKNKPIVLFRATPDMEEQVWMPEQGGWKLTEFLLDVMQGWGDTYPISEEMAKKHFPKEAFK